MDTSSGRPGAGLRLHQFVLGALPTAAYLVGWVPPVWAALGLSLAALVSVRFAVVARLYVLLRPSKGGSQAEFHYGAYRFDEAVRVVLLGLGVGLLMAGPPPVRLAGWLSILAVSATSILAGATGCSVTGILYAVL